MGGEKNKPYDSAIAEKANSKLARRLQELITDPRALAKHLGCTIQAINQYKQGTAYPKTENLIKIADFYNVSVDYLLGITKTPNRDTNVQAVCEYTGLSPETVNALHHCEVWPEVWGHDYADVIDFLMLDAIKKPANSHFRPILEVMHSFLDYPPDKEPQYQLKRNGDISPISNGSSGYEIPLTWEWIEKTFLAQIEEALICLKREWITHTDKEV